MKTCGRVKNRVGKKKEERLVGLFDVGFCHTTIASHLFGDCYMVPDEMRTTWRLEVNEGREARAAGGTAEARP